MSLLPAPKPSHGGDERKGKRKTARPFDPKRPLHVTMRSSRARGEWSMLRPRNRARIGHLVERIAYRRSIKIYRFANVGNHLHFLLQAPTRKALQGFLREVSGAIASFITGAKKGNALKGKFWDHLAWSRVVHWGRDFLRTSLYVVANLFEAAGYLTSAQKEQGIRPISIARVRMRP